MKKISFTALVSMVLSCVICSIAVNWVALPNGFVVTGITGLAMTAQAFTGINYALIYYGLMLLILVLTFVMLGYPEVSNILFLLFPVPPSAVGAQPLDGGDHFEGETDRRDVFRRHLRGGRGDHLPPGLLLRRHRYPGQDPQDQGA